MSLASEETLNSLLFLYRDRLLYLRVKVISIFESIRTTQMSEMELHSRFLKLEKMEDEIEDIDEAVDIIKAMRSQS